MHKALIYVRAIYFKDLISRQLDLKLSHCICYVAQCTIPLGMESGEIPDSDISASSSFDSSNVGPQIGRVRVEKQGGAWCPRNPINSEAEEWIQVSRKYNNKSHYYNTITYLSSPVYQFN